MIRSILIAYIILAFLVIWSGQSPAEIAMALLGTGVAFGFAGALWHVERAAPGRPSTRDIPAIEDYVNTEEPSDVD